MGEYLYRVYKQDNQKCAFYDRESALKFYKDWDCIKVEEYTKDLRPTVTTIIDKQGFDIERIRMDNSIKSTTKALRKAIYKYDSNNTKQYKIKLNLNTDVDIINYLDSLDNKQGYIKELILNDLKKKKNNLKNTY